jgi:hypothetical protein
VKQRYKNFSCEAQNRVFLASLSKASVRLLFEIDETSTRFQKVYAYTLNDLMTQIGAWMGLISLAAALLGAWQSIEKGGPKDHFAIYLLPEGPCSLGRALLFAPK